MNRVSPSGTGIAEERSGRVSARRVHFVHVRSEPGCAVVGRICTTVDVCTYISGGSRTLGRISTTKNSADVQPAVNLVSGGLLYRHSNPLLTRGYDATKSASHIVSEGLLRCYMISPWGMAPSIRQEKCNKIRSAWHYAAGMLSSVSLWVRLWQVWTK